MRKIIVNGRLGADAITKVGKSGTAYLEFRMANNEYGDAEGTTHWFRVTSFMPRHQKMVEYLKKGHPISVIGTVTARAYVNQNTNNPEVGLDILADDILFDSFGGAREGNNNGGATQQAQVTAAPQAPAPAAKVGKKSTAGPEIPMTPPPAASNGGVDDLPF